MEFEVMVESYSKMKIKANSKEELIEMIENGNIPDEAWDTLDIFEENILAETAREIKHV